MELNLMFLTWTMVCPKFLCQEPLKAGPTGVVITYKVPTGSMSCCFHVWPVYVECNCLCGVQFILFKNGYIGGHVVFPSNQADQNSIGDIRRLCAAAHIYRLKCAADT
eukprot:jgi/Botrbrau1/20402/Bobra.0006s0062.1